MAKDIAKDIVDAVSGAFLHGMEWDPNIDRLYTKIRDGTANYKDANDFAIRAGELLGECFKANVKASDLPNGRMYYNIASRVMQETLNLDYQTVSSFSADVQKALNNAANIGLKVFVPELDQSRIDGIVDRLSEAENYDDIKWILDEPLVNFSQSIVDDTIRGNARLQSRAGLEPVITRVAESKACKWCRALAGTYPYGEEPSDFYRRHENCRCQIIFEPGNGKRQNAWSKKWL